MTCYIKHPAMMCAITLLMVTLAQASEQEEPSAKKIEPAAAIVNGERIPMSRLDKEVQRAIMIDPSLRARENVAELRKARREALDYLIDQELMFQEGKKEGLKAEDAAINAEFVDIKQRFPSQEAFEQAMKAQNMTEEKLRETINRALIIRKVIDTNIKPTAKPVTDEEVASFYEENKDGLIDPEKVKARHILIKVSPDASDEEKDYAKNEMKGILEEARSGADFSGLAKKNSQCQSAPNGGDLGYFTRGRMVKPFEEAAFALQLGQISDIVETQYGYHIILLEDKKPERQLELKEVAGQIKEALWAEKVDIATEEWLKPIKEKATIKVLVKG
jgi:peptidyl-prolyl cis-trans isomerase C